MRLDIPAGADLERTDHDAIQTTYLIFGVRLTRLQGNGWERVETDRIQMLRSFVVTLTSPRRIFFAKHLCPLFQYEQSPMKIMVVGAVLSKLS